MFFQRGQVTILALLLGLLGLTIGLSVASRSLSDLRQVTVVDQGTKALAAAEAGVQYALNQLSSGAAPNCNPTAALSTSGISLSNISGVKYNVCSNTANFGVYPTVAQDEVVQVNIANQSSNVKGLSVLWRNPAASVEIIKINVNQTTGAVTEVKYVYNGTSVSANNGFATSIAGSNCVRTSGNNLCADASFNSGSCAGYWGEIPYSWSGGPGGGGDTYIRVKPMYASTDLAVCNTPAGNSTGGLALQFYQVTAVATTSGGITKKIQTSQVSSYLPSIFDNVIYSGGGLAK